MQVPSILSIALAIVWSAVGVSCFYDKSPCTTPVVRKEWRAFSVSEKTEWIQAVNVRMGVSLTVDRLSFRSATLFAVPVTPTS